MATPVAHTEDDDAYYISLFKEKQKWFEEKKGKLSKKQLVLLEELSPEVINPSVLLLIGFTLADHHFKVCNIYRCPQLKEKLLERKMNHAEKVKFWLGAEETVGNQNRAKVYIGRWRSEVEKPNDLGFWGNPFKIGAVLNGKKLDRGAVIFHYKLWWEKAGEEKLKP